MARLLHRPPTSSSASRATVRPVAPQDEEFLYAVAFNAPERWSRVCRIGVPNRLTFGSALWQGAHSLYTVSERADGRPLGLIGTYDWVPLSRVIWAELVWLHDEDQPAVARELWPLIDREVERFALRRVYFSVPEFAPRPPEPASGTLEEQGRLTQHISYDDYRWDLSILAFTPAGES